MLYDKNIVIKILKLDFHMWVLRLLGMYETLDIKIPVVRK